MRILASDVIGWYRPKKCGLRVYLRHHQEPEPESGIFEQMLNRLGLRHEMQHLESLGPFTDLTDCAYEDRFLRTKQCLLERQAIIYQGAFSATVQLDGISCTVVGYPDFLIRKGNGYSIQDAKLALRIENHWEISLQLQIYGWLYEKNIGTAPVSVQVYSGTGKLVEIPYPGETAVLEILGQIARIKALPAEPYEPVGVSKCTGCSFHDRCWEKAEKNNDVSLLMNVDQHLARALRAEGVHTHRDLLSRFDETSLAEFKRPAGDRSQKVGKAAAKILMHANLLENKTERILSPHQIPEVPNYVMFDLEGLPPHLNEMDRIYLWGMQVFGTEPGSFMPAVTGFGPDGDQQGWEDFLRLAKAIFDRYGDIPFVHWAPYERTYINRYIDRFRDRDAVANRVLRNLLDLYTIVPECIALPVPSYSLKVIEKYVGFERTQDTYGGSWAMALFIEATETVDETVRQAIMDKILKYNEEDLAATWAVFQWFRKRVPAAKAGVP